MWRSRPVSKASTNIPLAFLNVASFCLRKRCRFVFDTLLSFVSDFVWSCLFSLQGVVFRFFRGILNRSENWMVVQLGQIAYSYRFLAAYTADLQESNFGLGVTIMSLSHPNRRIEVAGRNPRGNCDKLSGNSLAF